ncbi:hypothetical protein Tco_0762544 [Tanacetum coccineum]
MEIIDREVKKLKRIRIPIVKVHWNSQRGPEFTWEREDEMKRKILHEVMKYLIPKECMEKAEAISNTTKLNTNDDAELSKEFLIGLRSNTYHGMFDEGVVDHIAKVLELLDLIKIPGMDSHQLRMKVFPLSLADEAKECYINVGDGKITMWEELFKKFFCKFYLESRDWEEKMLEREDNGGIDPFEFMHE